MVRLEHWITCIFLLVVFSAVHDCIGPEPIRKADTREGFDKKMSAFVQKKNCKDVLEIQQSDPNNGTIGKVPLCEGNSTTPMTATNSTGGGNEPPELFPEEGKGKKIETTLTVQETPNNTKNSSNLGVGQPGQINANPVEVKSSSNITSTNDNAEAGTIEAKSNSNITDNGKSTTTDTKSSSANTQIKTDNAKENASTAIPAYAVNNSSANSSKVDTEVGDLLKSPIKTLTSNQIPDVPPNVTSNATGKINTETELIENGDNTEDIRRNSSSNEKLSSPGVPLVQGQLAAILAGVFVVISVTAYVGLLSWRRYLENRYGNREMLVNEDEFNDDLRHFSI